MTTNRLEAFSDGVFAVAITLLVLEISVPAGENLLHDLKQEWPSFAAFAVSFWVIGIIWVNHHGVIDHLRRADRGVLYLNLLVLMTVVFIPFSTELFAVHLKSGADEKVAALVYSSSFLAMGVSFGLLWTYVTSHRETLGVSLTDEEVRDVLRKRRGGAGDSRPRGRLLRDRRDEKPC
jgi:TMEM175 potassium channel family protein